MKVALKGSEKKIKLLLKKERIWMKKNGVSIEGKKEIKKDPEPTAKEVADKIALCKSTEELEAFKSDTRQVVVTAYKKKSKELE